MRDVRINKDVPVGPTCKMKQSDNMYILDFRNKKIPPIIITFVQVFIQSGNKIRERMK